jgi:squalene cyclase
MGDSRTQQSSEVVSNVDSKRLSAAIARARRVLLQSRRTDGSWISFCDLGPAATAQVLVGLRFIGHLDAATAESAQRWLIAGQRNDGSFVGHPFASEGDLGATACAWAAFAATGLGPDSEPLGRARSYVERHGGASALAQRFQQGDLAGLFLALAGCLPPDALPEPNLLFAALPPLEHFLERRFNLQLPLTMLQTGLLLRHLRGEQGGLLAGREEHRCLELLDAFQNHDGSWFYGDTMDASIALATLKVLGVPADDARVTRGLAFLRGQSRRDHDGLSFSIFNTDIWPTAFALRALLASGSERGSDEVARAAQWLAGAQIPAGDERGTWSFQSGNQTMPDSDDVGVTLGPLGMALDASSSSLLSEGAVAAVRPAVERGLTWLLAMQNADGGWPAFQHGMPSKKPGPMMMAPAAPGDSWLDKLKFILHPPAELGDPSTEDVTGRVLHGLGQLGYTTAAPEVQRALAFLREQQMPDGSFWGRWVVNYLAGTAWVVRGLAAVGAPFEADWIRRALGFLVAHQNADGGWGEDVASYRDPQLAGRGASTPGLTGLVLAALLEADVDVEDAAIERGVRYLLGEQRPDGSWPNGTQLHALVPPALFYTLPGTELQQPLEALGLYRAARAGALPDDPMPIPASESEATRRRAFVVAAVDATASPRHPNGAWDEKGLRKLTVAGDPQADAVIDEIFAAGETAAVNQLMRTLARAVDPMPAGLPPATRAFLQETALLPPWADPARIEVAQELFTRCGWGVGAVLFCSSLPQCYAFPEGARVLMYTQGTSRHAWRRVIETGQMVFDVASEGGLDPQGHGVATLRKVRLMHAAIRHLVEQQKSWDPAWGVPINQVQLVGTLLAFSSLVVSGLRRLGFEVSAEEADAWVHLWGVTGHVLGIREDLRPRDMADAEALFDVLRTHWGASPEGEELTRATLDLMRELLPDQPIDGLPSALVRHLAGEHCADLLGVPRADWTALLVQAGVVLAHLVDFAERRADPTGLARHVSFALMKSLHGLAREGKNVDFRIPDALIRRWDDQR